MLYYIFCILIPVVVSFRCDRRPYGAITQSSEPDGRYKVVVVGLEIDAYIPDQLYTVQITATDEESTFTSFMISVEGETIKDSNNPRRMISLSPGELKPISDTTAKFSGRCPYSLEQTMSSVKSSVEVNWQAPPSGNGCVTLRVMVAENDAVWFEDGTPLTKKLCEDMRQPDDVAPQVNAECGVCDEAKYELSFTGIWSRNTHPYLYPENDWVPKYSDLVGSSHKDDFILWAPGAFASDGFKAVAEHANTSVLEAELREKIGDGVRTIIKGKGHGYLKMGMPTYSFFRVDQVNHLFSAVVGLSPSPDWFLGVSRFELCQEDNTWLPERELNLYPWDAGTDSGVSYESANYATVPPDSISRVEMSSYDKNSPFYQINIKDMHPFGKFHIKLVRTYHRECPVESTDEPQTTDGEDDKPSEETKEETKEASSEDEKTQPQTASSDDSTEVTEAPAVDCPMTDWQNWSACEGECIDDKIMGYQWRERYHLVDGVPVEKYDPMTKHSHHKKPPPVPEYCKKHFEVFDQKACEAECPQDENEEEDDIMVERRIMQPVKPGSSWHKRRDLKITKFV